MAKTASSAAHVPFPASLTSPSAPSTATVETKSSENGLISHPHRLLRSSRARALQPELTAPINQSSDKKRAASFDDDDEANPRFRQRTSSTTAVATLRVKITKRSADAPAKPMLPTAPGAKTRMLDVTTAPAEDTDCRIHPRTRQRTDSTTSIETIRVKPKRAAGEVPSSPVKAEKSATAAMKRVTEVFALAREDVGLPPKTLDPGRGAPAAAVMTKNAPVVAAPPSGKAPVATRPAPPLPLKASARPRVTRSGEVKACAEPSSPVIKPVVPLQEVCINALPRHDLDPPVLVKTQKRVQRAPAKLQSSDFDLSISFGGSPHLEVWDRQEDDLFFLPVMEMRLMLKEPENWVGVPITIPNVKLMDIACHTTAVVSSSPYSICAPDADPHSVFYYEAKTKDDDGKPLQMIPEQGICIDAKWHRMPKASAKRGLFLRFFVPLPSRLFVTRETRTFRIESRIWIEDSHGDVNVVEGQAEMSVSHLMRGREMDGLIC